MKEFLSRLFGKSQKQVYNIVSVSFEEIKDGQFQLEDIFQRKIDGLVIRNGFSNQETEAIIKDFESLPDARKSEVAGIKTYPSAYSSEKNGENAWNDEMEKRHLAWEESALEVKNEFSVNYINRLQEVFTPLTAGADVAIPKGVNGHGIYSPPTIRKMRDGIGVELHCERQILDAIPSFFKHLKEVSDLDNYLSYFVMLNPRDIGGELTLYDVEWKDAEKKLDGQHLLLKNGKKINIENKSSLGRQLIRLNAGDVIIFAGSSIWHRVEKGASNRMTFGGFLSKSRGENSYHMWS